MKGGQHMPERVLVGNIELYSKVIRECLKTGTYYLTYYEEKDEAKFSRGGDTIFTLKNMPYESAKRLAEGLGLSSLSGEATTTPHHWMKHSP